MRGCRIGDCSVCTHARRSRFVSAGPLASEHRGTAVATVKRQTGLVLGERHYHKARVDGRGKAQLLVTKDDSEFKRLLS